MPCKCKLKQVKIFYVFLSIYSFTTSLIASTRTLNLSLSSERSCSICFFCLVRKDSLSIISFQSCFFGASISVKGNSVSNSNFINRSPLAKSLSEIPFWLREIVVILFREKTSVLYSKSPSQRKRVRESFERIRQSR